MSENYNNHYNESAFWDKIKNVRKKIGKIPVENTLLLYYILQDEDTPIIDKGIIVGALGYLIFPMDLIPDTIPFLGLTDDATTLANAIRKVYKNIKIEHRRKAKEQIDKFFG